MAELQGTFTLSLNAEEEFNSIILDSVYIFRQLRNTLGYWSLSVSDEDGNPLVLGVKIVAGSFIFEPYANVPFDIYVPGNVDPTRNNLNEFVLEIWSK